MRYRVALLTEYGMYSEVETDFTSKKKALKEYNDLIREAFNKELVIAYIVDGKEYPDIAPYVSIKKKTDARFGECETDISNPNRKKYLKFVYLNKYKN